MGNYVCMYVCVIVKLLIFVSVRNLVSQLSLTDVEFQSHTFKTTKWIALFFFKEIGLQEVVSNELDHQPDV